MSTPWEQLNSKDRERVQLIIFSLQEFSFGYDLTDRLSTEVEQGSDAMRFHINSLYQYCCNYYLVGGANKLLNVLKQIGSGDLLVPAEALLEAPLGKTKFGEILRTYRDKFLTHQTFTFRPIQKCIYDKYDMIDPDNATLFQMLTQRLFFITKQLHLDLMARFPEAHYSTNAFLETAKKKRLDILVNLERKLRTGDLSIQQLVEQRLNAAYAPLLMSLGMSLDQAKETFSAWLNSAKEDAEKEGTTNLPEDFGDQLLQNEATDPKIKAMLSNARREGANDDDIRNWWNLHDLERRIMLKNDENTRIAIAIDELHQTNVTKENLSQSMDKAADRARKYCPFFGDPDDCTHVSGDDRPLPFELKFRINGWIQRKQSDPNFKDEVEGATTLNAIIREEIAKDNL
jgi:hypothetical protein